VFAIPEQQAAGFAAALVPLGMQHEPPDPAFPSAHVFVLQQPPLQAVSLAPPHALPHLCEDVSQACPAAADVAAAQSVASSQPHVSDPLSHFGPFGLPEQSTQAPPEPPQAAACVPFTQAPAALQQPPLQG
jgi:hypothetical protein